MKKTINIKVKICLQPALKIRKINSKYPKNNRLAKKSKDKAN